MAIQDPNSMAQHVRNVFGRLADAPIWVAWEARPNSDPSKPPIKVPISPKSGYPAKSNDASTWAPLGQALSLASRNGYAGIGVMLGPDPDQNPNGDPNKPFLIGVDYDNALKPDGYLTDWAQDLFIDSTYSEISPSGTGVKALAMVSRRPEGIPDGQDGVTLRLDNIAPAVNGKRPGIEVYTGRRWFAITGQTFRGSDQFHISDVTNRIPQLLRYATASPIQKPLPTPTDPDHQFTAQDARDAYAIALTPEQHAGLAAALNAFPDLAKAIAGDDWTDRSIALFTAADLSKAHRLTFEQFVHALMASTGSAAQHLRDQPDTFRALARAWERSPQPIPITNPGAIPEGARMGDRAVEVATDLGAYADIKGAAALTWLDDVNPLGTPYTLPADLYENPPPLPKFLLSGIFPSAPSALVGTGGVYKSTIWMAMALNMLLFRPQWGRTWWQGGAALMISKEDERSIMLRRIHDLLHGMNVTQRQYRDIIATRFYLDDLTEAQIRLVESDGKGNLHSTMAVDQLIEKYERRGVTMAAIDPMVNFGPGETHGNDGAAMMMSVAWRLSRAWAGDGLCNLTYIHHISMNAAREEVEDAHAGRSASAIGDNARSVFVLHRHKVANVHRHVAPQSIPAEIIERGDVIRLKMAKNSYARMVPEPFWAYRDNGAIHFVEPLDPQEARAASAAIPTPAEAARQERENVQRVNLITWAQARGDFTRAIVQRDSGLPPATAKRLFDSLLAEGVFKRNNGLAETFSVKNTGNANSYGF